MATPLTQLGAVELAQAIAAGQTSSSDAVEAYIARMQQVHPRINAMVWPLFEQARAQAQQADALQRSGAPLGPLHGVPITIKECLDLRGTPSTFGYRWRADHSAEDDDPYVARLCAAGAIPLAKSNVAQALMYYESDNPVYGRSLNPWNAARAVGGSSGGEAALIAAHASPLGLGNDIGGSVRVPAAFCGITSLKPTSGRCNDVGRWGMSQGQQAVPSQVGVMARCVADVALGTGIINGGADPDVLPPRPLADWRKVSPAALRVGWYTDDGSFAVAPAVARAVREAAELLRGAGVEVVPWTPPDARGGMRVLYGIFGADGLKLIRRVMGDGPRTPQIRQLALIGRLPRPMVRLLMAVLGAVGQRGLADSMAAFGHHDTAHYWELLEAQGDYQRSFAAALDNAPGGPIDVLLCPPCALPAFTHGASTELLTAGAYACLYNLLGYPAGVVPVTRVGEAEQVGRAPSFDRVQSVARRVETGSAGLPICVQVVARPWREDHALALMRVIEQGARGKAGYPTLPPL